MFCDAFTVLRDCAALIKPPEAIAPAAAAAKYLRIDKPGGAHGLWDPSVTPYSLAVMDALAQRRYEQVVFVAPAQTGKTAIAEGFLAWAVLCSPGDLLIMEPSEAIARDRSKRRIDRIFRHSPELKAALSPRSQDVNVFDKVMRNSMMVSLGWPCVSQLSGRSLKYVLLSDADRYPSSIEGEGSAPELAKKRLTAYGASAVLYVESTPGYDLLDGGWRPQSAHDCPPAEGVVSAYLRGTRHRWYWTCPDCRELFRADFEYLHWEDRPDPIAAGATAHMVCPHCGSLLGQHHKRALNATGRWRSEADAEGRPEPHHATASFMLQGPAAAFVSWPTLVTRYLQAQADFARTGSEESLRAVTTTDLGLPYLPKICERKRTAEDLIRNAEDWVPGTVPVHDLRTVIATVDVQATRFVAAMHGYAYREDGLHTYLLERCELHWSERLDADGRPLPLDPAGSGADWRVLNELLDHAYELPNGDALAVAFLAVDSGGKEGVAQNAYAWFRSLGARRSRVRLVKGEGINFAAAEKRPRVHETLVGGIKRGAAAVPEVPLLLLNSNEIKDICAAEMARLHMPRWLPDKVFEELVVEQRTQKGWEKAKGRGLRNEQGDLLYYARAVLLWLGCDRWGAGWEKMPPFLERVIPRPVITGAPGPERPPPRPTLIRKSSYLTL